jgi:hypothetical protein
MYFITAGNDRNFIVKRKKELDGFNFVEGLFGCNRTNILRSLKGCFLFLSTLKVGARGRSGCLRAGAGGYVDAP